MSAEPAYDAFYYAHDCGIPYERNDHWLGFFGDMADRIVATYKPRTVLDAGCAMGILVECLHVRGVDVWGVDVSEYAIGKVHESVRDRCFVGSLADGLPEGVPDRFDMVTCVEVIEHLPPELEQRALATLTGATDRLYLSSSPLDYGEATHLNVHPPEYWGRRLVDLGFVRDVDGPHMLPGAPWGGVYERTALELEAVVEGYERVLWHQRQEITDLRNAIGKLQHELSVLVDAGGAAEAAREVVAARDAEIAALREHALNLRDAVMGAEAELGEARGMLVLTQQEMSRYVDAAQRLEEVLASTSWKASQALLTPLRRVRGG